MKNGRQNAGRFHSVTLVVTQVTLLRRYFFSLRTFLAFGFNKRNGLAFYQSPTPFADN